ncbi:hypothetical protein E2C01_048039 [Portunus trituberculatus]|uniref:Uncharacterized protein n=1 Tax=Portunus trituberculatus TaxID=210409 RepID=A0A5B7G599_PORTR|nr:hypothetical protein [Portunus trituberculatus]
MWPDAVGDTFCYFSQGYHLIGAGYTQSIARALYTRPSQPSSWRHSYFWRFPWSCKHYKGTSSTVTGILGGFLYVGHSVALIGAWFVPSTCKICACPQFRTNSSPLSWLRERQTRSIASIAPFFLPPGRNQAGGHGLIAPVGGTGAAIRVFRAGNGTIFAFHSPTRRRLLQWSGCVSPVVKLATFGPDSLQF